MRCHTAFRVLQLSSAVLLLAAASFAADAEKVLYSFQGGSNGDNPTGPLVADAAGNLYGAAEGGNFGCEYTCGIIFELSPGTGAQWTEKVLYTFTGTTDGGNPNGGLIFDSAGNLYGTAQFSSNSGCSYTCGVVFELSPNSSGSWTETVLHTFTGNPDGSDPNGGLLFDSAGNLYGTTGLGGNNYGTVFELSPNKSGGWSESVIYSFSGYPDGYNPMVLILDTSGNLYGTTFLGGATSRVSYLGYGTVFELTPSAGLWTKTTLYKFQGGGNGGSPGSLVMGPQGNLYVMAQRFGNGYGAVFELKQVGNQWDVMMIHNFCSRDNCADGSTPFGNVILDQEGNLYSTTYGGGQFGTKYQRDGVVLELSPAKYGWKETVLHNFGGVAGDGTFPNSVMRDASGNFFGTTGEGGSANYGTVFEITPDSEK